VFSYFNVAKSFTAGSEINMTWQVLKQWQITGGYQFVFAADKAVMQQLKAGEMYGREEGSNEVYKLQTRDYYGLPGRSRHMANLKLMYTHKTWQAGVRAIYRNRWGTFDKDGNGIINRKDETAEGFVMLNANISKQFAQRWRVSAGAENLLNHRDADNLPNIPGINGYVSVSFQLINQKSK
jgi:outer membrane receptor for ferrienterochelin and colicins